MVDASSERPYYGDRVWTPKDGYNLAARVYKDWYWQPFWHQNEKPYIERNISQIDRARLSLDLGCGTGAYCRVLEAHGRVVGVDQSVEMLQMARHAVSKETELICGRASAIPLRDELIDMSVAARTLSHEPDLQLAFEELARVTRKNGFSTISEVHGRHAYPRTRIALGNADVHIQTFKRTPEELTDVATSTGFWNVDQCREIRWSDLTWQPDDERFFRIDKSDARPIFYVVSLRRR